MIKYKRFMVSALLAVPLMLAPTAKADVDINDASAQSTISGTTDSINIKGTDTTQSKIPKVSALYSLNAFMAQNGDDVYYLPTLDSVPIDLGALGGNTTDINGVKHKFAAMYTGDFDTLVKSKCANKTDDGSVVYYDTSLNVYNENKDVRSLEILGYDFLLSNEECKISKTGDSISTQYEPVRNSNTDVALKTAIMDTYKALGKYQYDIRYIYAADPELDPSTSPIAQLIPYKVDSWDTTEGKTFVWVTRTNSSLYWKQAQKDGLIRTPSQLAANFLSVNENKNITMSEFCLLVKNMMELYGEPVITDEEKTILLDIYGKNMPYYLDKDELEAVEYLTAKGILYPAKYDYKYTDNIDINTMLDILMAVKDKDSRATFKDVKITTDAGLLAKGYYKATGLGEVNPISKLQDVANVNSVAAYFDYLIPTDVFSDPEKVGVQGAINNSDVLTYKDITKEGHYWYKIKASKSGLRHCLSDNQIILTDGTKKFKVRYGGGVFKINGAVSTFDSSGTKYKKYVDSTRKSEANDLGEVYLASNYLIISLKEDTWKTDVTKITYSGTSLSTLAETPQLKVGKVKFKVLGKVGKNRRIQVTGLSDAKKLQSKLTFADSVKSQKTYDVYCKDDSYALVNWQYLLDMGIASQYDMLNTDTIRIVTRTENIYICKKQNIIIVGNTVFNLPDGTIPFQTVDGQLFIDYRATTGWTYDYFIYKDNNGNVSISLDNDFLAGEGQHSIILPTGANGERTSTNVRTYNDGILLTSTFAFANYFVYRPSADDDETQDYLFVIKQNWNGAAKKGKDLGNSKARKVLKKVLGFKAPDTVIVQCYPLYHSESSAKNPSCIGYKTEVGYYFTPKTHNDDMYVNYYKTCLGSDGKFFGSSVDKMPQSDLVLPFSKAGNRWYCLNFNMFEYEGKKFQYGTVPAYFANGAKDNQVVSWKPGIKAEDLSDEKYDEILMKAKVTAAPTGIVLNFLDLEQKTWADASMESTLTYYGTMKGNIANDKFMLAGIVYAEKSKVNGFNLLKTSNSNGYILGLNTTELTGITEAEKDKPNSEDKNITLGDSLRSFDWNRFKFKNLVENIDDWITILMIASLNIIPRIGIYFFITLIALSFIVTNKPWIRFCDNIFDIYKFLTIGRQTVHTINAGIMLLSSIVGMAIFFLFMDGNILNLLSWIGAAGAGIIEH